MLSFTLEKRKVEVEQEERKLETISWDHHRATETAADYFCLQFPIPWRFLYTDGSVIA